MTAAGVADPTGPTPQQPAPAQPTGLLARARQWARRIKRDTYALFLAVRDPRTPWYAKVVAASVVAYAFSPIDLIPDFIPVLGYLDDVIIVPLGIVLALKLIPADVMADCRARADANRPSSKPRNYVGAVVVVVVWLLLAALAIRLALSIVS
jgi:uncharacterized membrane protein YkvA (DUF1232 family)